MLEVGKEAYREKVVNEATSVRAKEKHCMDLENFSLVNKKCVARHSAYSSNKVTCAFSDVLKVADKEDVDKMGEEVVAFDGEVANSKGSAEGPTVDTLNVVDKSKSNESFNHVDDTNGINAFIGAEDITTSKVVVGSGDKALSNDLGLLNVPLLGQQSESFVHAHLVRTQKTPTTVNVQFRKSDLSESFSSSATMSKPSRSSSAAESKSSRAEAELFNSSFLPSSLVCLKDKVPQSHSGSSSSTRENSDETDPFLGKGFSPMQIVIKNYFHSL